MTTIIDLRIRDVMVLNLLGDYTNIICEHSRFQLNSYDFAATWGLSLFYNVKMSFENKMVRAFNMNLLARYLFFMVQIFRWITSNLTCLLCCQGMQHGRCGERYFGWIQPSSSTQTVLHHQKTKIKVSKVNAIINLV